jgi:hypothetical protein
MWVGKTSSEASNKEHTSIAICKDSWAYFYAECTVESDSEGRPIKWTFDFGDGSSTTKYTYNISSGPTSSGTYSKTASHKYESGSASPYTAEVTVQREDATDCGSKTDTCTVTVVEVDSVDTNPADQDVACTNKNVTFKVITSTGGNYDLISWSGGGNPIMQDGGQIFTTKWSSVGTKTVTSNCDTCSESKDIEIIDGLAVLPKEAYVCVSGTKSFTAWACESGSVQDVTASSTFSTSNGTMSGSTLTASSSPSTSEGYDWVRATYDGDTTDSGHDCDLTVFDLEIQQPSNEDDFDITQDNYTTTNGITFQANIEPTGVSGDIEWELDLEYQTAGGYGSGSDHREFQSAAGANHTETYSSMGGKVTINASVTIDESTATDGPIYITVTGTAIPDATITARLKTLYDPESGGTDSICCGIASKESSYIQFKPGCTKYGRTDRWPHESFDGGTHIGLMQVETTFTRAWDWLKNTEKGVNIYEENINQSHIHVNNVRSAHPGLRDLTAVEHENNALSIYRCGNIYYYRWNDDDVNPDWEINTSNTTGVNYADDVRERAESY